MAPGSLAVTWVGAGSGSDLGTQIQPELDLDLGRGGFGITDQYA